MFAGTKGSPLIIWRDRVLPGGDTFLAELSLPCPCWRAARGEEAEGCCACAQLFFPAIAIPTRCDIIKPSVIIKSSVIMKSKGGCNAGPRRAVGGTMGGHQHSQTHFGLILAIAKPPLLILLQRPH